MCFELCRSLTRPGTADEHGETGVQELRRIACITESTRESAFDGYTAEQCINMMRACWRSDWDILPDALTDAEREYAARYGFLSGPAMRRLKKEYGG